ncbi:hypothetical protein LY78DRAFT_30770 [Colletotrichum sublineola]|nr:hypothetical protein LY78DRAFT_30770 [Colletotrichum sublineola]
MTATLNTTLPSCLVIMHFRPAMLQHVVKVAFSSREGCISLRLLIQREDVIVRARDVEMEHTTLYGVTRLRRHFNTAYAPRLQSCLVRVWGSVDRGGRQLEVGLSNTHTHTHTNPRLLMQLYALRSSTNFILVLSFVCDYRHLWNGKTYISHIIGDEQHFVDIT